MLNIKQNRQHLHKKYDPQSMKYVIMINIVYFVCLVLKSVHHAAVG